MTILLSDNIVSALGFTASENYLHVKQGRRGLQLFTDRFDLPEPFMASAIDDGRLEDAFASAAAEWGAGKGERYTRFEKAAIVSASEAVKGAGIDPSDSGTIFILSTTKGNISLLDEGEYDSDRLHLWRSAELTAGFFGNTNRPTVVSSACISGISAMIAARRALEHYRYAVVTGADVLSRFTVAGFQSFKALSQDFCRPFDANRTGLNIGEAAATVVMTNCPESGIRGGEAVFAAGAARNDANHISGPSRTGEGAYMALRNVMQGMDVNDVMFVNAHGTATPYNDEMEAVALTRAGLQDAPINSLKGYFGHTLGAAGILESILSVRALKEGTLLAASGFETPGVSLPLNIIRETQPAQKSKRCCIKMLSGFGGCNAAALFELKIES